MNRRKFVSCGIGAGIGAGFLEYCSPGSHALTSLSIHPAGNGTGSVSRPALLQGNLSDRGAYRSGKRTLKPMLYGSPRPETDLDAWFAALRQWKVGAWATILNDYRCSTEKGVENDGPVVPLLSSALPQFRGQIDAAEEQRKAAHILRQADCCRQQQIDFWCGLPFPIFPSKDLKVVQRCAPEFFAGGKFNLLSPRVAELLQQEIRALKAQIPNLKGINLWMAEGSGSVPLSEDDLNRAAEWQPALLKAFDDVTRELGIGGILFAHEYLLTVGERRAIYKRTAKFPRMVVQEDITWPEEDMLHPFLGYLPAPDRALLFQSNPVALNYLLDTEYIGQGVIPSVYPRWWKRNVSSAEQAGVAIAMGRTFFWDGGFTDVNFNRMNAYLFAHLCANPMADEQELLSDAVKEMFGAATPPELIDILWQTEPVIKDIIGINGIDPLSHSGYPPGETLDILYTNSNQGMKAVSDLFERPGTPLYPPLTDGLRNLQQWRWQNQIVCQDPKIYLHRKRSASAWVAAAVPRVERLSASLSSNHRELVVHAYRTLNTLASGMELYVEAADLHYRWAHAKELDDSAARAQFGSLADRIEQAANGAQDNALDYKKRMFAFASFLRTQLPRIGNCDCGKSKQ